MGKQQPAVGARATWWDGRVPLEWCVLGVVVAFGIGAGLSALLGPRAASGMDPDAQIEGVVTVTNEDGTSICLTGDQDNEQHCSEVYLPTGSGPLGVGERVVVTVARVPVTGGFETAYIVTDRNAAPADDAEGASQ